MKKEQHDGYSISVITVNFNGFADTCAMLDTIPQRDDVEVIVVDNASRTDEASLIAQRYPNVVIVRCSDNLGFAGGNNEGIKVAHGKYLYFVNNDTLLHKQEGTEAVGARGTFETVFQPLIDRLESDSRIAMVCPKIRFAWGNNPIQFAGYTPLTPVTMRNSGIGCGEDDHGQYEVAHTTPYAHGAAMMVRREAIDRVGMMPECYFLYYEELDWSLMMTRAGYEIWYEPRTTIYHKESQTTGQASPLRTYYITRNRLLFARRNIRFPQRWLTYAYLVCLVTPRDLIRCLFQRRTDLIGATLSGIRDFLRNKQSKRS